jgi:DNA-binding NarL/FixJ family response regulator
LAPLDLNVSLPARETEVLIGIKDGERAKETAQRLDLSVKSIYMMRSELKRKLQLSDNDSIEAWVNKQTPKA